MLLISQVIPGIKAAIANVCAGDGTTATDGENTSNMSYLEAQNKIKGCTDNMTLTVATEQKYGLLWWHRKGTSLIQDELASEPQEILHTGSTPNQSSALYHLTFLQLFPRVITNHCNNPVSFYSENI